MRKTQRYLRAPLSIFRIPMPTSYFVIAFFMCLLCMGLGALAYERWVGRVIAVRKKSARRHPLRRKPLVSKDELQVWHWLEDVFRDQHVMLKMPLTSFAEPNSLEGDAHWVALLGPVNFSCVVADRTGTVLGCVDVLREGELLQRKHAFKRELLGRAGIPYWAIENRVWPEAAAIREKFLAFIPHAERQRRAMPSGPAPLHANFTRAGAQASALASVGISPVELRATLGLDSLTQALVTRPLALAPEPAASKAPSRPRRQPALDGGVKA
jgi:hypothetical protein